MGEVGEESSPVSESCRETGRHRKRDSVGQTGFGGYCCVFSPCSTALTLPAARLGVCRLCGLYQQASQECRLSSVTNNRTENSMLTFMQN